MMNEKIKNMLIKDINVWSGIAPKAKKLERSVKLNHADKAPRPSSKHS